MQKCADEKRRRRSRKRDAEKQEGTSQPEKKKRQSGSCCMMIAQKNIIRDWNNRINNGFEEEEETRSRLTDCSGTTAKNLVIEEGPCNCEMCASETGISVPQVLFKRNKISGYVATLDTRKTYRLVLKKRWLGPEEKGLFSLPFGFCIKL